MPESASTYNQLLEEVREAAVLNSCAAVLGWDERTYMPTGGASFRGEQMALLAKLSHARMTSPKIGEKLDAIQSANSFESDSAEAANVREIRRQYQRAVKLPPELVEELARVTSESQGIWQEARGKNDFASFLPWLEKILVLKRREADAIGYEKEPYDALLDEYEPGATCREIEAVFASLRHDLVPLLQAIALSPHKPKREILEREYPVEEQKRFGEAAANAIGFDFASGRLDTTTHPFCSGIGPGDCRITTRYNPKFFNESFFGILHEAGHGIYEQGLDAKAFGSPLGSFASLGIHESQSRLWENQIGRSRPFWTHFLPLAKKHFPKALADVGLDDWLFAINEVRPSLIRVEADEVTYNLHIILRFELEKELLRGNLKPRELPGVWRDSFRDMFGIVPETDREGCLQDIHWSMGGFGYFPTYTLGNIYAAQFMKQTKTDLPNLEGEISAGQFGSLKAWLRDRIHRHGQRWRAGELCRRATGEPLDHRPFIDYLRAKFGELYRLR